MVNLLVNFNQWQKRSVLKEYWNKLTNPDGVRQRQSDGQWESFRYGYDQNGDTNNEELHELIDVFGVPRQLFDGKCFNAESHDQDNYSCDSHSGPYQWWKK